MISRRRRDKFGVHTHLLSLGFPREHNVGAETLRSRRPLLTPRPSPAELEAYITKHDLKGKLEKAFNQTIVSLPEKPIRALIDALQSYAEPEAVVAPLAAKAVETQQPNVAVEASVPASTPAASPPPAPPGAVTAFCPCSAAPCWSASSP